ncbi:MAG TPA: matrixin family metalloprotease [Acidimicrobiales bacterium]|nr:matrixin family metalloprotease [Acidimicrobiales bacterium]
MLVACLATLLLLAACGGGGGGGAAANDADPLAAPAAPLDACPAKDHVDTLGIRSLDPNEIAKLPITYTFLRVNPDGCTPARFNPCEPVHYIQNGAVAPAFVVENTREAFRRLAQATGMTFIDDGLTDEDTRNVPYVPARYPGRWAPILISWQHFSDEQTNGQSQILGNTVPFVVDGVTVSARLRFNVDAYNDEATKAPIGDGFGPPAGSGTGPIGRNNITWGRILLHELAHVAGLGHTSDLTSLMYPDAAQQTIRPTGFSKSDLTGLRYLGKEAGCTKTPPLPAG